jgi:hypothetical protein
MYRPAETPIDEAKRAPATPGDLPTEHLEAELCELAAHLAAGMSRWIALVDEYDRREGWGSWWGVKSTAHWISWRCACSTHTAREHVRVARALRDLPLTREAFARGELSYSKVRALTRVAIPDSEEFLLHQARYATAVQLDHMLSAYRHSEWPDPEIHGEPKLTWAWNRDGSLKVEARLAADDGRAFLDALEAARSWIRDNERETGAENVPAGTSPEALLEHPATNADALSLICESFMVHSAAERAGPQRRQLIVHVDVETLQGKGAGHEKLEHGPAISPEVARRLGCDSALQVLVKCGKKALYLGRRTRSISPALNIALRERDEVLSVSWLHPSAVGRRPPHRPLGEGGRTRPRQPDPPLPSPPPPPPRGRLLAHRRRERRAPLPQPAGRATRELTAAAALPPGARRRKPSCRA